MAEQQREINRQRLILQRELAHRLKNTLAIAQAIVAQTLKGSDSIDSAAERIGGRLSAMAAAQDILTETSWSGANISEVVENAVKPHVDNAERIRVSGPQVVISAHQALGLALALHELATNAVKYGALSVSEGRIAIDWVATPSGALRFEWRESGGPPAMFAGRKGFGSRLTERIVPAYFGGKATVRYEPTRVIYILAGKIESGGPSEVSELA